MPYDQSQVYPGECRKCGKQVRDAELGLTDDNLCWACDEEATEEDDERPEAFFQAAFSIANAPYEGL